jgi:hypothetical protein
METLKLQMSDKQTANLKKKKTLRGPSWVIIMKAYFLDSILRKLLSDKNF